MDTHQESKIAWLAWLLLDEVHSFLWDRYEKQFLEFLTQEQDHLKFLLNQEQQTE
jgi:hypothetical protein